MNVKSLFVCLFFFFNFSFFGFSQPRYNLGEMQREYLGRGLVAFRADSQKVCLSWRYLSADSSATEFCIYRNKELLAKLPADGPSFWVDEAPAKDTVHYEVRPLIDGVETHQIDGSYILPPDSPMGYIQIPLDIPAGGKTPFGQSYSYSANDASIGDVDGDGEYEIILKWDPSNAHDNAHDGYTGNVLLDCYRLNGEHLWRIDLGRNMRAGAHYTQFMVYDFDGDGRAEVVVKTADGTVDGVGNVIGTGEADYRELGDTVGYAGQMERFAAMQKEREERMRRERERMDDSPKRENDRRGPRDFRRRFYKPTPQGQGRILTGPEYLTVFNGLTGEAMCTVDYVPSRGDVREWGDGKANRSDRFLACIAYLDGKHPSVVMCRGYYTRTVLAAFDWDGKQLTQRWVFDTDEDANRAYAGQGNHNLRVGDVDGDGYDEIIYGSMAVDHDGTGLYTTRMGHGDAIHLTAFYPDSDKLQVWDCHENKRDGSTFRDAATGEIIFQLKSKMDVGRCMAADIDPTSYGVEMWSLASGGIRNVKGKVVNDDPGRLPCNMAVWWDDDLLRELLNGNQISKYDWEAKDTKELVTFAGTVRNNGSKSNPCLHADIIGDCREEVLLRTEDNSELRLYISPIPTEYKFHTFLEDPVYRISIATQNVSYNQPTQPGFYFGSDLKKGTFFRGTYIK